mgnify:CR=1 FL=1
MFLRLPWYSSLHVSTLTVALCPAALACRACRALASLATLCRGSSGTTAGRAGASSWVRRACLQAAGRQAAPARPTCSWQVGGRRAAVWTLRHRRQRARCTPLLPPLIAPLPAGTSPPAGMYTVVVSLFLPGVVLILGAGFIFGFWRGLLAVWAGGAVGQALAFLLARWAGEAGRRENCREHREGGALWGVSTYRRPCGRCAARRRCLPGFPTRRRSGDDTQPRTHPPSPLGAGTCCVGGWRARCGRSGPSGPS